MKRRNWINELQSCEGSSSQLAPPYPSLRLGLFLMTEMSYTFLASTPISANRSTSAAVSSISSADLTSVHIGSENQLYLSLAVHFSTSTSNILVDMESFTHVGGKLRYS